VTTLSVVICTRDRPVELERCLSSILHALPPGRRDAIEVIIVDDGALPDAVVDTLRQAARSGGLGFAYIKRPIPEGLFPSRVAGLADSRGEIILFLDDDVTIAPDYLVRLAALYERSGRTVGISGVDQLDPPRSAAVRLLHRLFLFDSGHRGRLSASGFAGSFRRWRAQVDDFPSEYLHGCNMAFRRSAIADLPDVPWLHGHSQADDLYMSHVAGLRGELLVSPALRVWHHRPSGPTASRPATPDVARAEVANMFRLLRLRHHSMLRTVGFFWTVTCFILKDATRMRRARLVPGYLRGVLDVLRMAFTSPTARSAPGVVQGAAAPHTMQGDDAP
jgi:cellulose synthase/poly-beta-1,6-N-acetylglucosamine synthase-like glycosyltransferase